MKDRSLKLELRKTEPGTPSRSASVAFLVEPFHDNIEFVQSRALCADTSQVLYRCKFHCSNQANTELKMQSWHQADVSWTSFQMVCMRSPKRNVIVFFTDPGPFPSTPAQKRRKHVKCVAGKCALRTRERNFKTQNSSHQWCRHARTRSHTIQYFL